MNGGAAGPDAAPGPQPSFREACGAYLRIGLESFGGPAAHIAVARRVLVDEKRWVDDDRFAHALNFCMLLPGPEATQTVTYVGWLLHGVRGGIAAGLLFVLPGALFMFVVSVLYALYGRLPAVEALFFGLKAAVLAVVAEAVLRVAKRALRTRFHGVLAVLSFLALFAFRVPFPAVIAAAAAAGFVASRIAPAVGAAPSPAPPGDVSARPSILRTFATAAAGLAVWFAPLALLAAWQGPGGLHVRQGLFFSEAAVVTFGGAYAVLAYVQQRVVTDFGWITAPQMLDGLGLAETTPGPLILVLQFVAFVGAYQHPGDLPPLVAGTLGALVCLWTTFVPCFVWIFAGAPWVERLRSVPALSSALAAITAAVLGVIANLAVWFAVHVLFARSADVAAGPVTVLVPEWGTLDGAALAVAAAAAVAIFRFRTGLGWVLAGSVALGAGLRAVM